MDDLPAKREFVVLQPPLHHVDVTFEPISPSECLQLIGSELIAIDEDHAVFFIWNDADDDPFDFRHLGAEQETTLLRSHACVQSQLVSDAEGALAIGTD